MAGAQLAKIEGTRIDGRAITRKIADNAEHRYNVFSNSGRGPTIAFDALKQSIESKGPKNWLPGKLETDKAALAIAAFEILKGPYADGSTSKEKALKALWSIYRADGAEVIETELKRAGQAGNAKVVALEYLLKNDPACWQAISRALDTCRDEQNELSSNQKLQVLNLMLAHAGPKKLNVDTHFVQREIGEVMLADAHSKVADGQYVEGVRGYLGAFQHYRGMTETASEVTEGTKQRDFASRRTLQVVAAVEKFGDEFLKTGKGNDMLAVFPEINNFYLEAHDQDRMGALGVRLMEAGKNMEGQKNYDAAKAAYETALHTYEAIGKSCTAPEMKDRAELAKNNGLAALRTLDGMGGALMTEVARLISAANDSAKDGVNLAEKAVTLLAEAQKSTDVGDAAGKQSESEKAHKDAEACAKNAQDWSADATALASLVRNTFTRLSELYDERGLAAEKTAVDEKLACRLERARKYLGWPMLFHHWNLVYRASVFAVG